ncbi:MAG: Hsp20/alpha crystallin family protein [Lentisphaerota bacterium]
MLWPMYTTVSVDPFSEMKRLQGEMNRLFGTVGDESEPFPAVNVWSNADEVVVTAEVPGIDSKDLNIDVQGDQLTLAGERKVDAPSEEAVCHRCERGYGKFVRSMRLPFDVESGKVSARYQNGVLMVTLPRAEASKPRKIAVTSE